MKLIILIISFLLTATSGFGQLTVQGIVKDIATDEPLVGVNLFDTASYSGTSTNHAGYFSMIIAKGTNPQIRISHVGYQTIFIDFNRYKDTFLQITLQPHLLDEIVIEATRAKGMDYPTGLVSITLKELEGLPQLLGEKDVLKALQAMPGISNGVEGTSGLIVRGGSVDQNLILLDDATIYNPNHLLGFVSVINSDAVKDLKMYTGGFPSHYGGRLSSVLDLTMKEGNKKKANQKFSLGVISSKILLEGPLAKDKSSYLISARSSYLGILLLPQKWSFNRGNAENYFNYWLYDLNGKLSFDLKKNARLHFSYYRSFDNWKAVEGTKEALTTGVLRWTNTLVSARYSRPINKNMYFNSVLGYSSFKLTTTLNNPDIRSKLNSGINDLFFKSMLTTPLSPSLELKYGMQVIYHFFTPVAVSTSLNPNTINNQVDAVEPAFFIGANLILGKYLSVNSGFRYSIYRTNETTYFLPEPRMSLKIPIKRKIHLSISYANMRQFIHLLSYGGAGLPNDVWVPSTERIPPEAADHYSISLDQTYDKLEWTLNFFYKYSKNLVDIQAGNSFLFSFEKNWQDKVATNGIGKSYGSELLLKKTSEKWSGWLGYTLAWHQRRFEVFNHGNWFPYIFDRRHELEIHYNYSFGKRRKNNISLSWIYQSGIAITTPVAYYLNIDNQFVPLYTDRNNNRSPDYHRLDVSYSVSKTTKKGHQVAWNFGVYNFYNRKNPFFIAFKNYPIHQKPNDFLSPVIGASNFAEQGSFLPLLPYVSYEIKFR